jgi:ATP/maltotriose-dependent transcriptional regulator MalT
MADRQVAFAFSEQALAHLAPENAAFHAIIAIGKSIAYYNSSANDIAASIECGYQAALLTQKANQPIVRLNMIAITAIHLMAAGRLHEADRITQQAILPTSSGDPQLPWIGWVTLCRAEILREWNELACAQPLATEAVSLCEQAASHVSLLFLYWGYAVLVRVSLSCGDLNAARTLLRQAEQIGHSLNQLVYQYLHSCFTTVDQVRLWLACGELDRATRWAEESDMRERHLTPFARE